MRCCLGYTHHIVQLLCCNRRDIEQQWSEAWCAWHDYQDATDRVRNYERFSIHTCCVLFITNAMQSNERTKMDTRLRASVKVLLEIPPILVSDTQQHSLAKNRTTPPSQFYASAAASGVKRAFHSAHTCPCVCIFVFVCVAGHGGQLPIYSSLY